MRYDIYTYILININIKYITIKKGYLDVTIY